MALLLKTLTGEDVNQLPIYKREQETALVQTEKTNWRQIQFQMVATAGIEPGINFKGSPWYHNYSETIL